MSRHVIPKLPVSTGKKKYFVNLHSYQRHGKETKNELPLLIHQIIKMIGLCSVAC